MLPVPTGLPRRLRVGGDGDWHHSRTNYPSTSTSTSWSGSWRVASITRVRTRGPPRAATGQAASSVASVANVARVSASQQFFRFVQVSSACIRVLTSLAWSGKGLDASGGTGASRASGVASPGALMKDALMDLGPAYVKLGQAIASRPDLFGAGLCSELETLQDQCEPFGPAEAKQVLMQDLGEEALEANFARHVVDAGDGSNTMVPFWECAPVASASLGQVYRAAMFVAGDNGSSGKQRKTMEVAVKVQRPDAREQLELDVKVLQATLGSIPLFRPVVKLVGQTLLEELDYEKEATNAEEFARVQNDLPFVIVPKPIRSVCTGRVLVLEWVQGVPPAQLIEQPKRLLGLTRMAVQCTITQLLISNVLHGDPHGGNLLMTSDERLAYLDFGVLCRVDPKHARALLAFSVHAINGDFEELARDLADMEVVDASKHSIEAVANDFKQEFTTSSPLVDGEDGAEGGKDPASSSPNVVVIDQMALNNAMVKLGYKYSFGVPPYYTALIRALAPLEGYGRRADPHFDILGECYPLIMRQMCFDGSKQGKKILREFLTTTVDGTTELRVELVERMEMKDIEAFAREFAAILVHARAGGLRRILMQAQLPPAALKDAKTMRKLGYAMVVFLADIAKMVLIPGLLHFGRGRSRSRLKLKRAKMLADTLLDEKKHSTKPGTQKGLIPKRSFKWVLRGMRRLALGVLLWAAVVLKLVHLYVKDARKDAIKVGVKD